MEFKEIFANVIKIDSKLATKNLVPGTRVYDEDLINVDGVEYRSWNPYRSKLSAAIMKGLKNLEIIPKSKVLYLGAATGTTSSHVSDIVEESGVVYAIELSERNLRELIKVCEKRSNMIPFLNDAREVEKYKDDIGEVDVIYQDVSSPDQAEILLRNAALLKTGGFAYVAIKSQSISSIRRPSEVFNEFLKQVSSEFKVLEKVDISSYDKMHLFVALSKR